MTLLTFKRTGTDLASGSSIDVDSLPVAQAINLLHLVREADFFELPALIGVAGSLDEPQFEITIRNGNGKAHTVSVNDAAVPSALRPLIEELSALAAGEFA